MKRYSRLWFDLHFANLILLICYFCIDTLPLHCREKIKPKRVKKSPKFRETFLQNSIICRNLAQSCFLPILLLHKFRLHSSSSVAIKFFEVFAERNLITIHQQEVPSSSLHFRRSMSFFVRKAKTFQLKQVYLFIIIHLKLKANQELISLLLVSSF